MDFNVLMIVRDYLRDTFPFTSPDVKTRKQWAAKQLLFIGRCG